MRVINYIQVFKQYTASVGKKTMKKELRVLLHICKIVVHLSRLLQAKINPELLFVQKSNDHRGIRITKVNNLNLKEEGTFVQEYVGRPLLVDGHKFDIGVYTIQTSIDPLRVYIYSGDMILR